MITEQLQKKIDRSIKCSQCGAELTGESRYVSNAMAHGAEDSWKFKHLRVGHRHFCNRECFERYKTAYWEDIEKKTQRSCMGGRTTCANLKRTEDGALQCKVFGTYDVRHNCDKFKEGGL